MKGSARRATDGRALRARGATDEELTDLVRTMQAEFLFHITNLLDDPGEVEPAAAEVAWALFQLNQDGEAIAPVDGLHESVLETDPTGRECRPRNTAD